MTTNTPTASMVPDGRLARSQRSRQDIVNAMFALCQQGVLVPTAQEIADEAGLALRTVFRHFSDTENLFLAADKCLWTRFAALEPMPLPGPIHHRIDGFVAARLELYQNLAPYLRASRAQQWRYATLRDNWSRFSAWLRKDLKNWFPELREADPSLLYAADQASCFTGWDHLSENLPDEDIATCLTASLTAILQQAEDNHAS